MQSISTSELMLLWADSLVRDTLVPICVQTANVNQRQRAQRCGEVYGATTLYLHGVLSIE